MFSKAAGIDKRDELTRKAIQDANAHAARGLERYTITVHSTGGGSAQLPRLTPYVVEHLHAAGHEVLGVQTEEWAYNAHISCRTTRAVQPAVHQPVPTNAEPPSGSAAAVVQTSLREGCEEGQSRMHRLNGPPEVLAAAAAQFEARGRMGTACWLRAKAIDRSQSNDQSTRTVALDEALFRDYVDTLMLIQGMAPHEDLLSESQSSNTAPYTANMMVGIAKAHFALGREVEPLDEQIRRFLSITGMPVPSHW